jgi:hypothetical protein
MVEAADVLIADALADLGFATDEARGRARAVLEAANLTNARKRRIAASKLPAVADALRAWLVVACARGSCRAVAQQSRRELVDAAQPSDCEVCGGAANRTEVDRMVGALSEAGYRHLVVVGGSPSTHEELRALIHTRLALRLVPGTDRRTRLSAKADLDWADIVVVWGGTQLDHKISQLYTAAKLAHVITCPRRGIAALAVTVIQHLALRR